MWKIVSNNYMYLTIRHNSYNIVFVIELGNTYAKTAIDRLLDYELIITKIIENADALIFVQHNRSAIIEGTLK